MSENTVVERFLRRTEERDGCLIWTGHLNHDGYGQMLIDKKVGMKQAHRVAYEIFIGPIPKGLELDHLCRVRECVNPAHMEPVTHAENVRRGKAGVPQASRTHCPRGHEYNEENTYQRPGAGPRRTRRLCQRIHYKAYRQRKKLRTS